MSGDITDSGLIPPPATPPIGPTEIKPGGCDTCGHDGRDQCPGCGGKLGGYGFPPCKECKGRIAVEPTGDPPAAPVVP